MIHLIELPNPDDFSTCHDESCIVHFSIAIPPGTLKDFYERMDTNGMLHVLALFSLTVISHALLHIVYSWSC